MDQTMEILKELIQELVKEGEINRLKILKDQFEIDIRRIGREARLLEKIELINKAIQKLEEKNNQKSNHQVI